MIDAGEEVPIKPGDRQEERIMEHEIIDRGGLLFILSLWQTHFSQPIRYQLEWPTGLETKDYQHLIGKKCRPRHGGGIYALEDGTLLRLVAGNETRPICTERRISQPRGTHEYWNGRWVK